jgi:hypothetical protein
MIGLLLILLDAIRPLRVGQTARPLPAVLVISAALTYQRTSLSGAIPLWEVR